MTGTFGVALRIAGSLVASPLLAIEKTPFDLRSTIYDLLSALRSQALPAPAIPSAEIRK
jgi:hypothetical protein